MTAEPRSCEEILADLAIALNPCQDDDAAYMTWHEAVLNLLNDVEPLLARLCSAEETIREALDEITRSPGAGRAQSILRAALTEGASR